MLIVITAVTFRNALQNTFVDWDDYAYVVSNELVRDGDKLPLAEIFTTPVSLNYHPLTILSLRINNNECKSCPEGISAKPFIAGNVLLHSINVLLVFFLLMMLSRKKIFTSFLVAAIFAIHPMHVESVAWISGRKDVLNSMFFLAGLIAWLFFRRAEKRKFLWLASAFLFFIFSCLSKPTAVVFPLIVILIDYWNGKTTFLFERATYNEIFSRKNLYTLFPFFALSIFFGIMAAAIQSDGSFLGMENLEKNATDAVNNIDLSVFRRFGIASYGAVMYVIKFIVPVKLSAFHPYPSSAEMSGTPFTLILWISTIVIIALAVLVLRSSRKTKLYAFAAGFFLFTIILVLQFVSVGNALMADRYSYLPYIGLSLIPVMLIEEAQDKIKRVLRIIAILVLGIFAVISTRQVSVWKNTEILWTNVLKYYPGEELAHRSRGKYYSKLSGNAGTAKERQELSEKAFADFTAAIKAGTRSSDVYEGMALVYESRNELPAALLFINKAISMNPRKGGAYYNRAIIYDRLENREAAIADLTKALDFDPILELKVLSNRAVLLLETENYLRAISDLSRLIDIDARNYMYYYNRAYAKLQSGDRAGAINDYREVVKLNPGDQETINLIRTLIAETGRK